MIGHARGQRRPHAHASTAGPIKAIKRGGLMCGARAGVVTPHAGDTAGALEDLKKAVRVTGKDSKQVRALTCGAARRPLSVSRGIALRPFWCYEGLRCVPFRCNEGLYFLTRSCLRLTRRCVPPRADGASRAYSTPRCTAK